ncbi:MAG: hypothetical protein HY319_16650 [Armatimonadetes bacterium]|nr:hypothetical protein [Armatimonadota bacterium]
MAKISIQDLELPSGRTLAPAQMKSLFGGISSEPVYTNPYAISSDPVYSNPYAISSEPVYTSGALYKTTTSSLFFRTSL